MGLSIQLVCPAPAGSTQGNRISANRWSRILRDLGHRVRVTVSLAGEPDLLVALHAKKSAGAARAFRERFPERPLVVAMTGTDLYADLVRGDRDARASLELADRLVVLHTGALRELPRSTRRRARVIHQSVEVPRGLSPPPDPATRFEVAVLAHLRSVKDPLRAALAVRGLPTDSRIRVTHLGRALDERLAERARRESGRNPRYRWVGERSRPAALRRLAASHVLVVPSRLEGGANVTGEAAALGVAILASRIDGNTGLLGKRHPGLFPVGDTRALQRLLLRAEREPAFLERLRASSRAAAPLFTPARERAAWRELLRELR